MGCRRDPELRKETPELGTRYILSGPGQVELATAFRGHQNSQDVPAASVLSDGDIHDSEPALPLASRDGRLPELDPGLVVAAVVKETTLVDGCTKRVSTLSAEGEPVVGEDREGSISFEGSVFTRRTTPRAGWLITRGGACSGVDGESMAQTY